MNPQDKRTATQIFIMLVLVVVLLLIFPVYAALSAERRVEVDYFGTLQLEEVQTEYKWIAPMGNDGPINQIKHYRVIHSEDENIPVGTIVTRWRQ